MSAQKSPKPKPLLQNFSTRLKSNQLAINTYISNRQLAISNKYSIIIHDLQLALSKQKLNKQQIEEQMHNLSQRYIYREKQFKKIIWDINQKFVNNQTIPKQVSETFEKIFSNFDLFNQTTKLYIQKCYNQNMNEMQRKISNILLTVNQQINKINQTKSLPKVFSIQKQIQQIIEIAQIIESDNIKIKQKLTEQTSKNQLLQSDRNILLVQILKKKQLISKLYTQNQLLKQSKYHHQQHQSIHHQQPNPKPILPSQFTRISSSIQPKFKMSAQRHLEFNASKKLAKSQSKASKLQSLQQNFTISLQSNKSKNINLSQNIIFNLKSNLQRQKKRNKQLTKLNAQLYTQSQQVTSILLTLFQQYKKNKQKQKQKQKIQSLQQTLLKNQKLIKIMEKLHKKVTILTKPNSLNSWIDLDFGNTFTFSQFSDRKTQAPKINIKCSKSSCAQSQQQTQRKYQL